LLDINNNNNNNNNSNNNNDYINNITIQSYNNSQKNVRKIA